MQFAVVILSVRGLLVRKFMLAAHAMGMTNGDWTFLDVEIFQVNRTLSELKHYLHFDDYRDEPLLICITQSTYWGDHGWKVDDEDDARARKAYESLLR